MPIIRIEKDKDHPFVMMDKTGIEDTRLSLKAKGLLSYLLSLPNDWQIYISELKNHFKDGVRSIASGLQELESYNYVKKYQKRDKDTGKYIGYEYIIYETPQIEGDNSRTTFQHSGNKLGEAQKNPENLHLKGDKSRMLFSENGKPENGKKHTTNIHSTKKHKTNIHNTNIKEFSEILQHWNSKDIIKHKDLNNRTKTKLKKILKEYGIKELKECIDRYAKIIKDSTYYYNTKWTLELFLCRQRGYQEFKEDGIKWINYMDWDKKQEKKWKYFDVK